MSLNVQNYDFGRNWDTILKYLTFPKINVWIKCAVFEAYGGPTDEYSEDICPADMLSSGDSHCQINSDLIETIMNGDYPEIISEAEIISAAEKTYKCSYCEYDNCEKCDDASDDIYDLIYTKANFGFKSNKQRLCCYIPFGACHEWNKHFSFPLAKELLPDRNWQLIKGTEHTTVYSNDTNEIFDIIFWGLDGRIWDYEFNKLNGTDLIYRSDDTTLGGNLAYEMSMRNN